MQWRWCWATILVASSYVAAPATAVAVDALDTAAYPEFDPDKLDLPPVPSAWFEEPAPPTYVAQATFLEPPAPAVPSAPLPTATRPSGICCGDGCVGWNFGVGVSFVQPRWSSNPAFIDASGVVPLLIRETDFNWNASAAPHVWFGYTGEQGLGFRTNWFHFDGSSETMSAAVSGVTLGVFTPVIGGAALVSTFPDDRLIVDSRLRMEVFDVEATKAFLYRRGQYVISGGVRYAYISQSFDSLLVDDVGGYLESLRAGHNASVFGPTAAISARYPTRNFPRLGLYGKGRGALLFGHGNRVMDFDSTLTFPQQFLSTADLCIPAAEVEVGFDWNRRLGRTTFFTQTGLTAQAWFGVGNAAGSSASTVVPGLGTTTSTDTGTLGLFGIRSTVGFNF